MKYLYDNEIDRDDITLSLSGVDPNYPVENVADPRLSRVTHTGGITAERIVISIDGIETITFDAVAIGNHNLTVSATIRIEGNATDSWGAPSFSQVLDPSTPIIWASFTSQSFEYVSIYIDDPTNSDAFLKLGRLFIGPKAEETQIRDTVAEQWNSESTRSDSVTGQIYADLRRKFRSVTIDFTGLDEAKKAALVAFFNQNDWVKPVFWIFDDCTRWPIDPIYGAIDSQKLTFTPFDTSDEVIYSAQIGIQEAF